MATGLCAPRSSEQAKASDVPVYLRRGGWWWGLSRATKWAVLIGGAVIIVLPFLWMVGTSFKPESDVFGYPLRLQPTHPTFSNYVGIWQQLPFLRLVVNSVVFAGGVTVVVGVLRLARRLRSGPVALSRPDGRVRTLSSPR